MSTLQGVVFAVGLFGLLAGWALVRRYKRARDTFDYLAADEAAHVRALSPVRVNLTVVPDGFTCLSCFENPALPQRVWCAVCAPTVDRYPAEPIERGGLR